MIADKLQLERTEARNDQNRRGIFLACSACRKSISIGRGTFRTFKKFKKPVDQTRKKPRRFSFHTIIPPKSLPEGLNRQPSTGERSWSTGERDGATIILM